MSEYQHTQIPKPLTEQVFEWANEVLWQCELKDPNTQTYGRRGKPQYGVDITGLRDDDPERIVGVQCKLKGDGKVLSKAELRKEVRKALTFKPPLSEYILCTTAPDDPDIQTLALELSQSASRGRSVPIKIRIMGWGLLERLISRHPKAINAFDPSHSGQGDRVEDLSEQILARQQAMQVDLRSLRINTETTNSAAEAVEGELDRQITDIAQLIDTAPEEAIRLLSNLQDVQQQASGRIKFRIAANIANCHYTLGQQAKAATKFIAAFEHDPANPKAQANKALGLLIREDWDQLKLFCEGALNENSENTVLAGYFAQGMYAMPTVDNPLEHVPPLTHTSVEVMIAVSRFYLQRDNKPSWYDAAANAYLAYPENRFVQELHADALIERTLSASGFLFGYRLTAEQESDLILASRLLEMRWEALRQALAIIQSQSISVPANLMLAYRLLDRGEDAVKIGKQALEDNPNEMVLVEKLAAGLLELEAVDEAAPYIERLDPTIDTVMMRYHLFTRQGRWDELKFLVDNHFDLFPEVERPIANAARVLAELHLSKPKNRRSILEKGVQQAASDSRALAIIAQGARRFDFDDLAGECYEAARNAVAEASASFATRYALAFEAEAHGDWRTITRMFYGHINMERDSPELRLLTSALINQYPVREQARSFFESLPETLKSAPYYLGAYGVMEVNRGDFEAAISALYIGYNKEPRLSLLNPLCEALFRGGKHEALAELISEEAVDLTPGSPRERMRYAHVLNGVGHGRRAIEVGYRALCEASEDPDLSQKYMGLILEPPADILEEELSGVAAGMWIEIANDVGAEICGIVDDDTDRPWGGLIPSSHAIVSQFLGAKEGHVIQAETSFGVMRTWTLRGVKPAWLRAWHDLLENSEARFPGVTGVVKFQIENGDFTEIFAQIRKRGVQDQLLLDNYRDQIIPLSLIAGRQQAGAVGFADFLLGRDRDVRTSTGRTDEFAAASDLIERLNQQGAVLDGFTAWRAAQFSILPFLKNTLGRLAIPVSEIQSLKRLVALQRSNRSGRTMTTSYQDGTFHKQEFSQEERAETAAWMEDRVAAIEAVCCVEPLTLPDSLPSLFEDFADVADPDFLAPAVLASTDRLLLSDDLAFRAVAEEMLGTKGVWLQAVARYALKQGTLSFDDYVSLTQSLVVHRHGVVSFDMATLNRVYRTDETPGLYYLEAMCRYLGHSTADCVSHVRLACTFLNQIWATSYGREARVPLATGIIIKAILDSDRGTDWARWTALMIANLETGPRAQLISWCQTTSKPLADALSVLNRMERGM